MKKCFACLLCLCLFLGCAPLGAQSESVLLPSEQTVTVQGTYTAQEPESAEPVVQTEPESVSTEASVANSATEYRDNFEDEALDTTPSHWVETYDDDSMLTEEKYTSNLVFSDDFSAASTLVSRGWSVELTPQNGQIYTNKNNLLSGVAGSAEWQNYIVEADVTVDESTYGGSGTSVSGLTGRSTASGKNGLEFSLFLPTPNAAQNTMQPQVRLYDRGAKATLASVKFPEYTVGTTYHLKMLLFGTTVRCYLDDVLYIETTCTLSSGSAGLNANNFPTYFDNVTVTAIADFAVVNNCKSHFKTADQQGNRVYRGSAEDFAAVWLHAFEQNPTVSARLCFATLPQAGRAGLLGRYHAEHTYVQGGYDFDAGKWYIASRKGYDFTESVVYSSAATLTPNTTYTVELQISGTTAVLQVNGVTVVRHRALTLESYGRAGLFVQGVTADFDDITVKYPSGVSVTDGVVSWTFHKNQHKNSLEIDAFGNEVVAFDSNKMVYSADFGKTFTEGGGVYAIPTGSGYSSTIEVEEGKYMRILENPMRAQVSEDLINWRLAATIVPAEENLDPETGKVIPLIHVGSLTKITLPNGTKRIFLPIGFRTYKGERIVGHVTRVFYTDDGGYTWQESENDTANIPGYDMPTDVDKLSEGSSFCEAKIISCADGTLRMYCTRTWATCVHYVESKDYGVTWSGWGKIESMPCAISSFGVCEDPSNPGTWYMVYVKDVPPDPNNAFPRTHLVLAKTTDGKNWTEVLSLDRTPDVWQGSKPVYQILDPSVTVTEGYIYVGYGRSDWAENTAHNAQRQRYLRLEREHIHRFDDAQDQTCNVCDHVRELPTYVVGDLNDDGCVTDADAVYLLMNTFFADVYPVKQPCDYNGDGLVTDADAVYLLMYTFFPEVYPIT